MHKNKIPARTRNPFKKCLYFLYAQEKKKRTSKSYLGYFSTRTLHTSILRF